MRNKVDKLVTMKSTGPMNKLVGTVTRIAPDTYETWIGVRTNVVNSLGPNQSVHFDCRIAIDNETDLEEVLTNLKPKDYVEMEGYMMCDNSEKDVMSIWFSVWKLSVERNGELKVIYKS